jgi:hypothetical protein
MTEPNYRCEYCGETFVLHRQADAHFHFEHFGDWLEQQETVITPINEEAPA